MNFALRAVPAAPAWRRTALFVLFAASGFSGLIYESIWSHYLKLFLGHAAYAQTLVLALFMGGMAIGAWTASRRGDGWRNLLRSYAAVEAVIGVAALAFHWVFVAATDLAYATALPALAGGAAAAIFKWSLAAALILPQSVLLGMTFPLMSAGLLRRHPERPGEALALLYFTNSLGAAVGVLASGFVLIERLGLPGTIQAAGVLNLGVAAIVWMLAWDPDPTSPPSVRAHGRARAPDLQDAVTPRLLLAAAFLTGAASFIYEIGWIRMLSLVLGAATHSFELMLSAFILGLALGGLWVRGRIDRSTRPVRFLGVVQVVMGLAALATLPLYGAAFDLMQLVVSGTAKTDAGYAIFLFSSHAIALAVMLPATFCAGMTLPLITYALLGAGHGERSIGAVYASNTLGSIVGVFAAAHLGMPLLGLQRLITTGAAIDVALGLFLLWRAAPEGRHRAVPATAAIAAAAFGAVTLGVTLDLHKMASGVFRRGELYSTADAGLVFYRDGKTASVSLLDFPEGLSLRTNGKSDGAINLRPGPRISDEITMVLTAALPLAYVPDARRAAVIGMGTGLSTHTMLGSQNIERVDTIEIEPAMAEAARRFAARNASAFADPRSNIVFEDAKTYFSSRGERYDIIVSEPSNPWVSGVSSLFTDEFYGLARRYLNPGGVLVQWFQAYEIDITLVASVMRALAQNFPDYAVYAATDSDILIVAGDVDTLARPLADLFKALPGVAAELRKVHVQTVGDIELRRLGGKIALHPLFLSYNVPPNSDYYPFLDLNAARYRFLQHGARELTRISTIGVPVVEMLEGRPSRTRPISLDGDDYLEPIEAARRAAYARDFLLSSAPPTPRGIPAQLQKDLELVRMRALDCVDPEKYDLWVRSAMGIARSVNAVLSAAEASALWRALEQAPCAMRLPDAERRWLELFAAVAARDPVAMARLAVELLAEARELTPVTRHYLLTAALAGLIADRRYDEATRVWNAYSTGSTVDLDLRLLYAYLSVAKRLGAAQG
ncbi:MAG: spermidine synthase [Burkholderiales bacterium]|nr:spermidine synthase [Burkholderiales bacterium]